MKAQMNVIRLAAMAGAIASCTAPDTGTAAPVALQEPGSSPEFFIAAVEYLVGEVRGSVRVDPRPLRPGADLGGIQEDDLLPGATLTTRMRSDALAVRGIRATDATADQRCTFSSGLRAPRDSDSSARNPVSDALRGCETREPYTGLIFGAPVPAGHEYPAGTWRMEAVAMDTSGFRIWDVFLRAESRGRWRVVSADARFTIWS